MRRGIAWAAAAVAGLAAAVALACTRGGPASPGASPGQAPRAAVRSEAYAHEPSPFPARNEVARLVESAVAPDLGRPGYRSVDRWELQGPFPERIGDLPVERPTPWESLLLETDAVASGRVRVSGAMRCLAGELARFRLAQGAWPASLLQQYLASRCGATGQRLAMRYVGGRLPPDADEARVFEAWQEDLRSSTAESLGSKHQTAGIAFARRGDEGVVVLVTAEREVLLEPVRATPDADGVVRLRGEILVPAEVLAARVNLGSLGSAECEPDRALALPRFAFRCPVDRGDETAAISLVAIPPGKLLGRGVLHVLARPSDAEARLWRRPALPPIAEALPAQTEARILRLVNRLRDRAGLRPLAAAPAQSAVARGLARRFFASELEQGAPDLFDDVPLALLAGWDVDGVIRDGGVGGMLLFGGGGPEDWVAAALTAPGLRSLLLEEEVDQIAIGPLGEVSRAGVASEAQPETAFGVLVATYALFDDWDPRAERERFYARLHREWQRRGGTPPGRDGDAEDVAVRVLERVARGELGPDEALDAMVSRTSTRRVADARGWLLTGSSFDEMALPEELFAGRWTRVAVGVGSYRPPDWPPWGRAFVLLVASAPPAAP